jgi:hypothetical protein
MKNYQRLFFVAGSILWFMEIVLLSIIPLYMLASIAFCHGLPANAGLVVLFAGLAYLLAIHPLLAETIDLLDLEYNYGMSRDKEFEEISFV